MMGTRTLGATTPVSGTDAERLKRFATYAAVAVAATLIAIKLWAWAVTGSVAMFASLVDSALDLLASALNLVAVRHALTPADRDELHKRGFLYRQSKKLAGVVPDGYHTTWHSRPYILERVSRLYPQASYSATPGHLQDWVAARRLE